MVPKSNVEYFLQAIIENSDTPFEAKSRIERYITDILEERVSTLEPVFRIEYYLAKISGADVDLPEPISRADLYLAALAGEEVTLPDTPNSSLEEYLARWCETGNAVLTITGNPVRFTGMTNTQIQALSVNLRPIQDLHGYSKPWPAGGGTNLIPLTVDTIKAANGGANTWNGNSKTITGVTYTILTDEAGNVTGINANGTVPAKGVSKLNLGTIHAVSGTTYGIKKFNADDGGNFFGNIKPRFSSATDANIYGNTTMTADSDKDVAVSYYIMSGAVANNRLITPFIAVTSIAPTVFAPYSNICPISGSTGLSVYVSPTQDLADATTYTEDWTSQAGTVYGGTLDIVTGVLTVDREMVDMGTMAWNKAGSGYYSTSINKVAKKGSATYGYDNAISSQYESVSIHSIAGLPNFGLSVDIGGNVQLKDSRYATAAELKSGLDGVQLCYELDTPITYQLTPQEVKSLLGVNNIWSDSGDVTVVLKNAETYEEVTE